MLILHNKICNLLWPHKSKNNSFSPFSNYNCAWWWQMLIAMQMSHRGGRDGAFCDKPSPIWPQRQPLFPVKQTKSPDEPLPSISSHFQKSLARVNILILHQPLLFQNMMIGYLDTCLYSEMLFLTKMSLEGFTWQNFGLNLMLQFQSWGHVFRWS